MPPSPNEEVLHIWTGPRLCNNRCVFCIDSSRGTFKLPGLPDIEAQLDRASKRTKSVVFTMGEPTLNPLLPAAAEAARRRGYKVISLVTNGRRLQDPAYCLRLLEGGINDVRVSLHGQDAAVHDAITRRPGSFEQTAKGLENLSALRGRFVFHFEASCVVVKTNVGLLRPIHEYVRRYPVDHLNFNVVEPTGNARKAFTSVMPRYRKVLEEAYRSSLDFFAPGLSLSRIPICAGGFDWNQENYLIVGGKTLSGFNPAAGKVQGPPCRDCMAADRCPGIWKCYVKAYGWGEFAPVMAPSKREGQVLRILTGSTCDNRCIHCVDGPVSNQPAEQQPVPAALRRGFLQGYRRVELAGGDVPLDPRCERWIREAGNMGYSFVSMETNARPLCAPRILDRVVSAHPQEVVVRLNAGAEDIHDAMARVPGAFRQTLRGILLLRSRGISFSVRLRKHPDNGPSLERARLLALRLGARRFEAIGD